MAGERPKRLLYLQVARFDTLHARAIRGKAMAMPDADLVIVDEAHLSLAATPKQILEPYADACILRLTPTPPPGDGRGPGADLQDLAQGPGHTPTHAARC